MRQLALFVVALFAVPWMLDLVLPTPSGDLTSFLIAFVPTVWSPTIIAVVFLLVGGGVAALRQELKVRFRYHHGASRWLALAVILPIVAVAAALLAARAVGDAAPFRSEERRVGKECSLPGSATHDNQHHCYLTR